MTVASQPGLDAVAEPGRLAELLYRHRTATKLSQRDLARRSQLSERAVRNLERGVTVHPRRHTLLAVADALGLADEDRVAFVAAGQPHADTYDVAAGAAVALPPPGDLVGRVEELRALTDVVTGGRYRVVTLTGPGGVGKSRLVAELVTVLRRNRLDVRTLDLAALGDPDLVVELIAEAFGLGGASRLPALQRVAAELRDRRAIVVLDNFERLVSAAPALGALVRRCPGLTIVITSQRAVRLTGERQIRLDPLPLPAAVELFAWRAGAVVPGFALTADNRAAVTEICRRVDGLPLAVELAAARVRLLTPAELAGRLEQPLQLLSGGARDLPARHQSLRATIEASLAGVDDDCRTLFAWFAPFPAGARLDDLEQVVDRIGAGGGWLLAALADLADASLVRVRDEHGRSRYVLLDAMRELAGELLARRPDHATVRRMVAARYLDRLRAAGAQRGGDGYAEMDRDVDNLRGALGWVRNNDIGAVDLAAVQSFYRYCELRGRFAEGRATLVALAEAGVGDAAWALLRAAHLSQMSGDLQTAARLAASAQHRVSPGDQAGRAAIELVLGGLAGQRDDLVAAVSHTTSALRAARAAGDQEMVGRALNNLAAASIAAGDLRRAESQWREALAVKQRAGTGDTDIGRTMMNLAELLLGIRNWPAAAAQARQAVTLLDGAGHPRLRANALSVLALASLDGGRDGDQQAAEAAMAVAVELLSGFGDDRPLGGLIRARQSVVLHACGRIEAVASILCGAVTAMDGGHTRYEIAPIIEAHAALLAGSDPRTAARLLGLAQAIRDHEDNNHPALLQPAALTLRVCRRRLGDVQLDRQLREGAALHQTGVAAALETLMVLTG